MSEIVLGYIYILTSKSFGKAVKLGSTRNISRRKWDYSTAVRKELKYYNYFEVLDYGIFKNRNDPIISMEKTLYKNTWFRERRCLKNKEFFSTRGVSLIEYSNNVKYVLDNYGVKFRVIEEDTFLTRPKRDEYRKIIERDDNWKNVEYERDTEINTRPFENLVLREYQKECVDLMGKNTLGKFILPTGVGKTVIFLQYLSRLKKTLILVPFIDLIDQTIEKSRYFDFGTIIKICDGKTIKFDRKNKSDNILYVSTYQSSDKEKYEFLKQKFDCIIFDECHYTVINEKNDDSTFQYMINNGKSDKKFFFTATEKNIKVKDDEENIEEIVSMNNDEIYGPVLYHLFLDTAIQDKILTDYNINFWLYRDKLKCIEKIVEKENIGKRILIFCNKLKNVKDVLNRLENNKEICVNKIDGNTCESEKNNRLKNFKEFNGVSVLILCKLLVVGFDDPSIDTVIHYDRCSSSIDFIQKNGRSLRLFKGKNKSNVIILTNTENDEKDFRYYKSLLNTVFTYDRRLDNKLKNGIREYRDRKVYNSIMIKCDEEIQSTIYDRFMNYISGYNKSELTIIKFKLLSEFIRENNRYPNYADKFTGKYAILGTFAIELKKTFIRRIKRGEPPQYYVEHEAYFTSELKKLGIWEKLMSERERITISEQIELLKKFILEYKRYPKQGEKFTEKYIPLGTFPQNVKIKFVHKIKKGEDPEYYKTYSEKITSMLKDVNLWDAMMNKKEREIIDVRIRAKLLKEFVIENKRYPKSNEKYTGEYTLLGSFPRTFYNRFIVKIKNNEEPTLYKEYKKEFIELMKDTGVFENHIKPVIIPILEKGKLLKEFILQYKRYPENNEKYTEKYAILKTFPNSFRKNYIYKILDGTEPKLYKADGAKILAMIRETGMYR